MTAGRPGLACTLTAVRGVEVSNYYDPERAAKYIRSSHRGYVGGMWPEIGRLQADFLRERGLRPEMRLLDIGCGCLRGGVHFVEYLDPGNYYGVDLWQELLDAGYDVELAALGLQDRLPRENLLCDGEFNFDRFGVTFDAALAQSVFTHLPLNHIRLCLGRLAPVMRPGAVLYATIFACERDEDWLRPIERADGLFTTGPTSDPYHYRYADIEYAASGLPWTVEPVGDWGHPREQAMVLLTRKPD
jgi:SAM-dependent methyltransferase